VERMVLAVVVLAAMAIAVKADVAGGENLAIPVAELPIPCDKCSVAATNNANMSLTLFSWGYDNAYWMISQASLGGLFAPWKSIGGYFAAGPSVLRNANNDIVVFGNGADRNVWYKVFHENGVEDNWETLGGNFLARGVASIIDPQGLIHVYVCGYDSAVWEMRQNANGTEALWGAWTSLGGAITGSVTAMLDAEGVINLFARGVNDRLTYLTQTLQEDGSLAWSAWQGTTNISDVRLASAASIVARLNSQNLIEVTVRGADKAFWHTRQAVDEVHGLVWAPWLSLGGIFSSAPSMQINSDQMLTVYGRGSEKGVWYKQQIVEPVDATSDSWGSWVPLGGRFSAGVEAITDSRSYMHLFGRGLDKSIWTRAQVRQNRTLGFFGSWSSLGGRFRSFPC